MMRTVMLAAALALLLAACAAPSAGGAGEAVQWRCDGGAVFSVRYGHDTAHVFAAGRTYTLASAPSGSGARYGDGAVELREHQGQATLSGAFGGPYENCRR